MRTKKIKLEKVSKAKTKTSTETPTIKGGNVKFADLQDGYSAAESLPLDYNPYIIVKYAFRDNIIRAAKNKIAKKVMSGGYSVEPILEKGPDKAFAQAEQFEDFMRTAGGRVEDSGRQVNFDMILFNTLLSVVEGDSLFWEIRDNNLGVPGEIHVLDWEDMRIVPEKGEDGLFHGKIKRFSQELQGKEVVPFEPEEIIYANIYAQGTRMYGSSLIKSVMMAAAGRMYAATYANNIFVNQKPKGIWYFDLPDVEFKKIKDQIKEGKMNPYQDITVQTKNSQADYKSIPMSDEMHYKDFIVHNRVEILIGMGVPPGSIFLSGETGGWEADVQLHEFDEDINLYRNIIESVVNDMLLPRFKFDAIKFRFNRTNKRDEEREARIVSELSDILTVNQRLEMIGKPPIEGGDVIRPKSKTGVGPAITPGEEEGQGQGKGRDAERKQIEEAQMEGIEGGRELNKALSAVPKQSDYFRKSYGSNSVFTKTIKKQSKITIGEEKKRFHLGIRNQSFFKMDRLIKNYDSDVKGLLKDYVQKLKQVVLNSDVDSILFRKTKIKNNLKKILNPTRETEAIEAIKNGFIVQSGELSRSLVRDSFDYGAEVAAAEVGMGFTKVGLDPETLGFLENMNVELVEGAFSEVAMRAKREIRLGMLEGESIPQIAKRLDMNVEQIYKNRSKTIARSEVLRAANQGSIAGYKKSGVVSGVQVLVGMDPDGQCRAEWGAAPGTLSKPMPFDSFHQIHCSCTCIPVPIVE